MILNNEMQKLAVTKKFIVKLLCTVLTPGGMILTHFSLANDE